jgi:hypothetical protein
MMTERLHRRDFLLRYCKLFLPNLVFIPGSGPQAVLMARSSQFHWLGGMNPPEFDSSVGDQYETYCSGWFVIRCSFI